MRISIYWRLAIVLLTSVIFMVIIWVASLFKEPPGLGWFSLLWALIIWATFEVTNRCQEWMAARNKPPSHLITVISSTLAGTLTYFLLFYGFKWIDYFLNNNEPPLLSHNVLAIAMGLIMAGTFSLALHLYRVQKKHYEASLQNERYRSEVMEANLTILKQQLDPHFLFNSLNTLYYLIAEDTELARKFLKNISEMYRYLLHHQHHQLIDAREELAIAHQYLAVIKQRYQHAFQLDDRIVEAELTDRKLPPLVLQQLMENAIKHNQLDPAHPLRVRLARAGDVLSISSEGRPRSPEFGLGSGIKNIVQRYAYLTERKVLIEEGTNTFRVTIPLL